MKNMVKNILLCSIGFIGGVVVTGYGVLKIVSKSTDTLVGIQKDIARGINKLVYGTSGPIYKNRANIDDIDLVFESEERAEDIF